MAVESTHTWVFLRGLAREQGHWGTFLERFAKQFPKAQVLAVDLPGTGEFHKVTAPREMLQVFNFVRSQVVERALHPGPVKVFALSLGAMVAMEWQRQRPEDLAGCVLVNSSTSSSPLYHRLRWQVWGHFLRLVMTANLRERESGIIDLIMNNAEARLEALPAWVKVASVRPVSYRSFLNQLLSASRFVELKSPPSVPTLLLNSLGDRLVDPSCSTRLHDLLQWPLRRHPWAGHDLTWDDPEWVLAQVAEWNSNI